MALTLHLGAVELPYSAERPADSKASSGTQTTGDVAGWLEGRYHVMEHFAQLHGQEIADAAASGLAGALENMMMGGPPPADILGSGAGVIEEQFRRMLDTAELEKLGYPGIPTEAAKKRRSSRFKAKKNPRGRPSFVDTGLYSKSFKAWTEGGP
jgi:hypothetical protein